MVADGAAFTWGESGWWQIASAILSIFFAVVEVWATAFIMRSWSQTLPASMDEKRLRFLWAATLGLLVAVMSPPIYCNVSHLEMRFLPDVVRLPWAICVAACTPVVIGGVGFAERADAAKVRKISGKRAREHTAMQNGPRSLIAIDNPPLRSGKRKASVTNNQRGLF